jgi:hypothetical protein
LFSPRSFRAMETDIPWTPKWTPAASIAIATNTHTQTNFLNYESIPHLDCCQCCEKVRLVLFLPSTRSLMMSGTS